MANSAKHFIVGGLAGVAPDFFLLFYGWRKNWLPKNHPLVMAHNFIHSWAGGLVTAIILGFISHIILDKFSHHRTGNQ